MDEIDLMIVRELELDGRLTNQELADRVGLSPSPCLRRVRRLERDGVITGYAANVDPRAVGLTITAFVRIRLDSHAAEVVHQVEERIREIDSIVEAYLMAGDTDYLLRVVVDSFLSYEELLRTEIRTIPSLASIETSFAFGMPKPRSPLPVTMRP
ncbi:Lrp/AsnC family transcriptional regulator [Nonomuraea sp. NPDC050310]|uniref:Lrp/AsnC family transcriptional regulator n=1 Tax=Nonomuraea sp. NPDC050310 TaxID=3154935 RepID=UPI0033D430D6